MFARLPDDSAAPVTIVVDGAEVTARAGDSVAAALLAAGLRAFRSTAVSGAPRGPFCMMGACFDCVVTIDGERNVQACLVRVADGMKVETA
jgi:predicted molibdopterin-dependent oxidoreductase YjgC